MTSPPSSCAPPDEGAFTDQLPSDPPPYEARRVWYPPTPLPKPAAGRMSVVMAYLAGPAKLSRPPDPSAPGRRPAVTASASRRAGCLDCSSWPWAWLPAARRRERGTVVVPGRLGAGCQPAASQGPIPGPASRSGARCSSTSGSWTASSSMYFELRNVGGSRSFLNTLYDYEPGLSVPRRAARWQEGGVVQTRRASSQPAILQPGRRAPT